MAFNPINLRSKCEAFTFALKQKMIFGLFVALLFSVDALQRHWIPDRIHLSYNNISYSYNYSSPSNIPFRDNTLLLTSEANGLYYAADKGHFRVKLKALIESVGQLEGISDCIFIGSTQNIAADTVSSISMTLKSTLDTENYALASEYFIIKAKKFFNSRSFKISYLYDISSNSKVYSFLAEFSTDGCSRPRTIGNWNDPTRWQEGAPLPTAGDDVVIPLGTGVVKLENDVAVNSLALYGGLILGSQSSCPPGWKSNADESNPSKCYRLYDNATSYNEADRACSLSGHAGNIDAHLVEISGYSELDVAKKLCRGGLSSPANAKGCWIGLKDSEGYGRFTWVSLYSATFRGFRNWRRFEPNNHTVTEGISTLGELCTHIVPWQEDPLHQEQGVFDDASCRVSKPYICQIYGRTNQYRFTVAGRASFSGGVFKGGYLSLGGRSDLDLLGARDSMIIRIESSAIGSIVKTLILEDGASLHVYAPIVVKNNSWIGELSTSVKGYEYMLEEHGNMGETNLNKFFRNVLDEELWVSKVLVSPVRDVNYVLNSNVTMQPSVYLPSQSSIRTISTGFQTCRHNSALFQPTNNSLGCTPGFDVIINARIDAEGSIVVDKNVQFLLEQGGRLSQASLTISHPSSKLILGGYGSILSTYDAFDLILSHSRPVVGEFLNDTSEEDKHLTGVYRLQVTENMYNASGSVIGTYRNITSCIPYNATAEELARYLGVLPMVIKRGGVTVRRYGDEKEPDYSFGYSHRIEFDAPTDAIFSAGSMTLSLFCSGIPSPCNCAEVKVSLLDGSGMPDCPTKASFSFDGRSSGINPKACVISPSIVVNRISVLSYTKTFGLGTLEVTGGVHRLPHHSQVVVAASGGRGIVGANIIDWKGVSVSGLGTIVMAGTSWASWDSANVLFMEDWEYRRGFVAQLDRVPPFTMTANTFAVDGAGSLYSASPESNLTFESGVWNGGAVGGRSTVYITRSLIASGGNKALRYGCTLFVEAGATFEWRYGNISLADGADIILEGNFSVLTVGQRQWLGQALLLSSDNPNDIKLLARQPGRNWHGYFDSTIPPEIRGGWYQNPLCGKQCADTNKFTIRGDGNVEFIANASVGFALPLNLIGQTKVALKEYGYVSFVSGGICGNDVVVTMAAGTVLQLDGGNFLMRAYCTIQGQGELLVSSGEHNLAFKIDGHITIEGGIMVWPLSNGAGGKILFKGGLEMKKNGRLDVQPFSTQITIYNDVTLEDNCLIQFPMIGITANAAPSDRQDAIDTSPRGIVDVYGVMNFNGGTLRGKADINAHKELYLDGKTKQIRSLAKLVNRGHMEWGNGDLIMDDNADFLNLGFMQMRYGAANFDGSVVFKGTVVPVENGGDVFADNYHSWDMDQNKLSTKEYVELRKLFVSRAPEGWTPEIQTINEVGYDGNTVSLQTFKGEEYIVNRVMYQPGRNYVPH